jgi:glucose/arabinose dehydrogenase/cytochrome c2
MATRRISLHALALAGLVGFGAGNPATAQVPSAGNPARGRAFFQLTCAVCHTTRLGPGNTVINKQGPSLAGVVGRRAGSGLGFNYTKALGESGLVWDAPALDRFLTNPLLAVPGTTMPMPVPDTTNRLDVIAYLATQRLPAGVHLSTSVVQLTPATVEADPGAWPHAVPGAKHRIVVADLPPPFRTDSAGNGPQVVRQPAGAALAAPPGFTVKLLAAGLSNPRLLRVAPNGDVFLAETGENRIRVLRAADGAETLAENQVFAAGLDRPFGIAFYPADGDPQWIYVANNNSVVRFPYASGDLKARGEAQVVVPRLCEGGGGHSTRDVAFSLDGKRMFISVGSGSNIAEDLDRKDPQDLAAWESAEGLGAAWGSETHRADVLVTDPEGHTPLRAFATGIRNGVGLAVNPVTGDLWVSTNERDGLGDDLVPDYITRVKEGGYYGWPWYYMGNHEDPRHAGERPDLAGKATIPDVPVQAHSASLEMTFYTCTNGVAAFPAEYCGDAFAAFHGSWNRSLRTGYKVVRVRVDHGVPTGEYDDFLTGFVVDNRSVWGRPVGVAVAHDGALLVTEDGNGTLWRIAHTAP